MAEATVEVYEEYVGTNFKYGGEVTLSYIKWLYRQKKQDLSKFMKEARTMGSHKRNVFITRGSVYRSPNDLFEEAAMAATFVSKYAGISILKNRASWEVLSVLTVRQNIYTDPQRPVTVEPKLYEFGPVDKNSPLMVTTNFSLTYYLKQVTE